MLHELFKQPDAKKNSFAFRQAAVIRSYSIGSVCHSSLGCIVLEEIEDELQSVLLFAASTLQMCCIVVVEAFGVVLELLDQQCSHVRVHLCRLLNETQDAPVVFQM